MKTGFPMSVIVIQASHSLNSCQVLAYSLGLGTLVQNETRLRLHMRAELVHNDSPYGLLVLTGGHPDVHVHLYSVMSSFAAHGATLIYSAHLLCVYSTSCCTDNNVYIAVFNPPFPKWALIRWLFCGSLESSVTLDQMWAHWWWSWGFCFRISPCATIIFQWYSLTIKAYKSDISYLKTSYAFDIPVSSRAAILCRLATL